MFAELGADLNQTGHFGRNGLLIAANEGKEDIIRFFHSKNNQLIYAEDDKGDTAVTLACKWADLETVKMLNELGADLNHTNENGDTAVKLACQYADLEAVILLKNLGAELLQADLERRWNVKHEFFKAVEQGKNDIIKFFLSVNDQLIHTAQNEFPNESAITLAFKEWIS